MSQAQETKNENKNLFNHWSIDFNGGLSRPTQPMTPSYYAPDFSPFHVDLGVRYMFNSKFGLKIDGGYDKYSESSNESAKFDGNYTRFNLQGVVNLGRMLSFEEFAERLNLQFHTGLGYGFLQADAFKGKDEVTNMLAGLTFQYRISNRIALNADFTMVNNISQHYTFDGYTGGIDGPIIEDRGFNGTLYNATLGLSIYLGKHERHADWFTEKSDSKIDELEARVAELETMLNDTDRDGVADAFDVEPNTITGIDVDTKGRGIDLNKNGVPDQIEDYIIKMKKDNSSSNNDGTSLEEMINGGYINVYFDFNSSKPTTASYDAINFVTNYLKSNPSKSAEVVGYADEIGNSEYNQSLSETRAKFVKDVIVKAGVDASRMTIKAQGEDNSVDANSSEARKLVRRVTFKLN